MAGFDYDSKAQALKTLLDDNNTTTSSTYLSQDLSTTVQNVFVDDPERVGIKWRDLPAVFIRLKDAKEDFAALGNTGPQALRSKKRKTLVFEVYGLYGKEGRAQTSSGLLTHVYDFARNVEAVVQANTTFGSTSGSKTLWSNPRDTDFGDLVVDGDAIKGFLIDLEAEYLFK